jgi:hypothetical protein
VEESGYSKARAGSETARIKSKAEIASRERRFIGFSVFDIFYATPPLV